MQINNLTKKQVSNVHLFTLIDRSGSMTSRVSDTIGGYNALLKENANEDPKDLVSTYLFDHEIDIIDRGSNFQNATRLNGNNYTPRGTTALLDAIGIVASDIKKFQNENPDHKIMFCIITDGLENASREMTKSQVKEILNGNDWEVIYLGANQDAITAGQEIGILNSHNYKMNNTQAVYRSVSSGRQQLKSCDTISSNTFSNLNDV